MTSIIVATAVIKLLAQASPGDLDVDLCIVGAGVAGIALAISLERRAGISVLLLEGGGRRITADQQELYAGSVRGLPARPLSESRFRCLGGSSARWYGRCVPFEDHDFRPRAWIPDSGWPICAGELDPFYRRATVFTGIRRPRSIDYEANRQRSTELGSSRLSVRWVDIRMTHFGLRYRRRLMRSKTTTVLLRAQVLKLERPEGSSRWSIAAASVDGARRQIRAERVVLAAGGVENARLMLVSGLDRQWPVADCPIGRYFMDHAYVEGAEIRDSPKGSLEDFILGRDRGAVAHLTLSEQELTAGQLHSCGAYLLPKYADRDRGGRDLAEFRALKQAARRGDIDAVLTRFRPALRSAPGSLWTLTRRAMERLKPPTSLILRSVHEQAPNRDNRVALGQAEDRFGLPLPVVSWHSSEQDARSLRRFHEIVASEVRRLRLGRFQRLLGFSDGSWRQSIYSARHHMGTTRMGVDPATSVVDQHCQVHGFDGLFVAGSSVFPTYSWANPTLTIMALALRLADHLAEASAPHTRRAGKSPPS